MIDDIALASVDGEVLTNIALRLQRESPFHNLIMITHSSGGSAGYIPDDRTYDLHTYQSTTARIKRGCAETGIVSGVLDLMDVYAAEKFGARR